MARLLIILLVASLILNLLTFLFVVAQEPPAAPKVPGIAKLQQDVESIGKRVGDVSKLSSSVRTIKGDVTKTVESLRRDLTGIKSRISAIEKALTTPVETTPPDGDGDGSSTDEG